MGSYIPDINVTDVLNAHDILWLMMKDVPVMWFNLGTFQFEVINEKLLPYQLKGREGIVKGKDTDCTQHELLHAFQQIASYFSGRVLVMDRANAKALHNSLGLPQAQTIETRRNIALSCRSVSLQDNYWVKRNNEIKVWNDVNFRTNSISDVVTQIALHGNIMTVHGNICTPELTTLGTYAKAWKREKDNNLYLYKRSTNNGKESQAEVKVSKLLDKLQIPHVEYLPAKSQGVYCCKCECMTSDSLSVLTALDFFSYCYINDIDPLIEMYRYEPTLIYQMFIVDYLFSNSDRHFQNWGFYYDCNTMEIKGCHPLFDHNNAFDKSLLSDKSTGKDKNRIECQVLNGVTMLEAAELGVKMLDFKLQTRITSGDFLTREHYKSFKFKAKQLGI